MTQETSVQLEHPRAFSEIITNSRTVRSIFQYMEVISNSPEPVLITGESGVGKELFAKAIHILGNREGNFVTVNVASLDANLFTDTLFGHEKGVFIGSFQRERRNGLIDQACRGTLFLYEIGDLTHSSQIKLLRLIQDGEFLQLGSDVAGHSDARVVVCTCRNLQVLQESGEFLKDLYHRLSLHHIHVPPLRERGEDLPILVDHFLEKASKLLGKQKAVPPQELFSLLATYSFPGNIRELEHMVLDGVVSSETERLSLESFKRYIRQSDPTTETEVRGSSVGASTLKKETIPQMIEKQMIIDALNKTNQNRKKAAKLLGISRRILRNKIKEYGL